MCTLDTKLLGGRTQRPMFLNCYFTSAKFSRRKRIYGIHTNMWYDRVASFSSSKQAGIQWKHPNSQRRKKFKVCQLVGKVIISLFCGTEGVTLNEFMTQNTMLTATRCEVCSSNSQNETWTNFDRCNHL